MDGLGPQKLCLVFQFFFYLLLVSLFGPVWFFLQKQNNSRYTFNLIKYVYDTSVMFSLLLRRRRYVQMLCFNHTRRFKHFLFNVVCEKNFIIPSFKTVLIRFSLKRNLTVQLWSESEKKIMYVSYQNYILCFTL